MKYRVSCGWNDQYLFDSADDAVKFALMAKLRTESKHKRVSIDLLDEDDLLGEEAESND